MRNLKYQSEKKKQIYINELVGLWANAKKIQDKLPREIKATYGVILGSCLCK